MIKTVGIRVFLVLFACALFLFAFVHQESFSINIFWSLFAFSPLFFAFRAKRSLDFSEPVFLILAFCFLGIYYRIFVLASNAQELDDLIQISGTSDITYGLFLVLAFNLFFSIAYLVAPKVSPLPSISLFKSKRFKRILFFGLIVFGIYLVHSFMSSFNIYSSILSGSFSSKKLFNVDGEREIQGYFRLGEVIFSSTFIVSYTKFLSGNKKLNKLCICSALIVIAFNVLTSSRIALLSFLFVGLLIRSFFTHKLLTLKLSGLLLALVICVTYMTGARAQVSGVTFSWEDSFSLVSEQLSKDTYSYTIDKTVIVTSQVPQSTPHLMGESFIAPLYAPIPRGIWADKPLIRPGPIFAEKVFRTRNERTGIPPSFPVEAYWNFGWIGVIMGGFCLGLLSGIVYRRIYPFRKMIMSENKKQKYLKKINKSTVFDIVNILKTTSYSNEQYQILVIRYCLFINMFLFPLMLGDFSGAIIAYLESSVFVYLVISLLDSKEKIHA